VVRSATRKFIKFLRLIRTYIESFNGKFRDECLNEHWFVTMAQARRVIESWRAEYNTERPHSSLGDLTPEEYAVRRIAAHRERYRPPQTLTPNGTKSGVRSRPRAGFLFFSPCRAHETKTPLAGRFVNLRRGIA
jgi:putative transposase